MKTKDEAIAAMKNAAVTEETATATGFQSDVTVTAKLYEGVIVGLTIKADGETPGFGQRTMEDADFQAQFIGKKLPITLEKDVDALSGATITSTAIVDALNTLVK